MATSGKAAHKVPHEKIGTIIIMGIKAAFESSKKRTTVINRPYRPRYGFELLRRGDAQLNKESLDEFQSVRFIRGKDPWHIPQGLEQGRQQVKGD